MNKSSGYTMIILLVSILIVALLSVYLMNKLYFKQSREMKENGLMESDLNTPPNLQNAQNKVDEVRNRMNEIQKQQDDKIKESLEP